MNKRRVTSMAVGVLLAASLFSGCASKQASTAADFPTKPITILNSSAAGSPTDVMAREIARHAEKTLGQSVIVENATGGGGGVLMAKLMKAQADGYTIASITAAQIAALQTELKKDFSFDDFEFLVNVQNEPYAIAVHADSPFQTMQDLTDYAKANPGKLKVGGQGTGSTLHLIMLQLADANNTTITWIPFGGGSESVTNLLGKNVDVISTAPATVNQYVEAGQIRVLSVTGEERMDSMKEVPTLKELGYGEILSTQYRGFFAKKGLPAEVKEKLVDALTKATQEPEFKLYMERNFQPDGYLGPEDFARLAKQDFDNIGELVKKYVH
ncbi:MULTISPECIES: tripartite tricarboxylate transporter substrate binding protein [unclassified Paenibacillus]|uniref:Bug family tripartite tricarboxylate transporter substrate binding protein n=1 Tax=unclassified Paenibacillus TaxID=185978 RepID=UPI001AE12649|nr:MULTISPECIES: tripartite tricarboxylate transporter substrate binding protein [unclassified Paenibacillus]MBP1154982.1 tripartite-type tricarboxylate transporter receptor subunit TctC [Paenibacillus sp. PvP091]MBP1169634.1 tripartite-type tricarboxylate transporter receptor subunit TctC [Paenibacillus sp. PvR098]MBP2440662.1 tripartite-type tricarboxylate transporter receptor subunit TctC [Paenibacillus sp. PvP052]